MDTLFTIARWNEYNACGVDCLCIGIGLLIKCFCVAQEQVASLKNAHYQFYEINFSVYLNDY